MAYAALALAAIYVGVLIYAGIFLNPKPEDK